MAFGFKFFLFIEKALLQMMLLAH
ncbi:hypothetical protein CGLO_12291 [Colletotrichum gloeosporioides Cg-14]|uniref:Uncharacterized protein n=1 Tax=Colletotrichum gloeosporioides (strain Cg-14) TaxID=1237896 RepID=T0LJX7_COLGC|nr:hypothetical protein CGLO_12291 [Colletotrichum gloeosporioides Cg-14]